MQVHLGSFILHLVSSRADAEPLGQAPKVERGPRPRRMHHAPVLASRGPPCVPDRDRTWGVGQTSLYIKYHKDNSLSIKIHRNESVVIFPVLQGTSFGSHLDHCCVSLEE